MTAATRQGARGSAGKGIPTVVPDVQHHYTAFFGDAGVRDLSLSLSFFLILVPRATHMDMETRVSGLPTRKGTEEIGTRYGRGWRKETRHEIRHARRGSDNRN